MEIATYCERVGIAGGCGPTCEAYKGGNCSSSMEMIIHGGTSPEELNEHYEMYPQDEFYVDAPLVVSKIVSVYDGDTFTADLGGNGHHLFTADLKIRIFGIDTPEKRGTKGRLHELALLARNELTRMLSLGTVILVNPRGGKYFRILADIEVHISGGAIIKPADHLLKIGLAKPYEGKKKPSWTSIME